MHMKIMQSKKEGAKTKKKRTKEVVKESTTTSSSNCDNNNNNNTDNNNNSDQPSISNVKNTQDDRKEQRRKKKTKPELIDEVYSFRVITFHGVLAFWLFTFRHNFPFYQPFRLYPRDAWWVCPCCQYMYEKHYYCYHYRQRYKESKLRWSVNLRAMNELWTFSSQAIDSLILLGSGWRWNISLSFNIYEGYSTRRI